MIVYVHDIPGRLRVKIPAIKGNSKGKRKIEQVFQGLEGINEIMVNTATGSVLVNYDCRVLKSSSILNALKKHGYSQESRTVTADPYIEKQVSKAGRAIGKALFSWAIGEALEGSALSFLAVLI